MDIKTSDINNGEGLRVSLWLAGCEHRCEGCHNPETWSRHAGKLFTEDTYNYLVDKLTHGIPRGLTITGGDPLADYNYEDTVQLIRRLKQDLPELNIWVYTGYYYDELVDLGKLDVLDYIDVLVDGRFAIDQKEDGLKWRGSSNQRIWQF